MQSEQQLLQEISRLKAAISNQTNPHQPSSSRRGGYSASKPPVRSAQPVVINGTTFYASSRSLVRQPGTNIAGQSAYPLAADHRSHLASGVATAPGLSAPTSSSVPRPQSSSGAQSSSSGSSSAPAMVRTKQGSLVAASRLRPHQQPASHPTAPSHPYAPRSYPRGGPRGRGRGRGGSAYRSKPRSLHRNKTTQKRKEPIDKPCREFTRRGVCLNGLKCRFKHDPEHVAICPKFMSDDGCPLPSGTCPLSHSPTPSRVPVCVHFANGARCRNGDSCKYPHIRLGPKEGVCRDFAVLGYCELGVKCPAQHVRECPDFAATGSCSTKGCRLPHVIRAQHKQKSQPVARPLKAAANEDAAVAAPMDTDEFISLTFDESSDEQEESSGAEESDEEEEGSDDESAMLDVVA